MDLIMLIAGIVLIVLGAKRKDPSSQQRTGGGTAMLTTGIVVTAVGGLWFCMGFMNGFMNAIGSR